MISAKANQQLTNAHKLKEDGIKVRITSPLMQRREKEHLNASSMTHPVGDGWS